MNLFLRTAQETFSGHRSLQTVAKSNFQPIESRTKLCPLAPDWLTATIIDGVDQSLLLSSPTFSSFSFSALCLFCLPPFGDSEPGYKNNRKKEDELFGKPTLLKSKISSCFLSFTFCSGASDAE